MKVDITITKTYKARLDIGDVGLGLFTAVVEEAATNGINGNWFEFDIAEFEDDLAEVSVVEVAPKRRTS